MLTQDVERYLAIHRAAGYKLTDPEAMLRSFANYAAARGEDFVRANTAVAWASQKGSSHRCHVVLCIVTRFALFMRAEDQRHEVPPRGVFRSTVSRPVPHIYSKEDIVHLVACAARLGPNGSLRPLTFSTMFGLMAVAGLRGKEVIDLRIADFTGDGLVIRETKFKKSRFVPLHETTSARIEHYLTHRRKIAAQTDHLFISLQRRKIAHPTMMTAFRDACARAGIGLTLAGKKPRLHDLRHTFAVHALERCPLGRDAVNRHILALTTYMGHSRVDGTYWYLEQTPQLLGDIAELCEAFVARGDS